MTHDIAQGHLPALADLDLAVDADAPFGDEGLRLTAGQDASRELQHLREVDGSGSHLEADARRLAHF